MEIIFHLENFAKIVEYYFDIQDRIFCVPFEEQLVYVWQKFVGFNILW